MHLLNSVAKRPIYPSPLRCHARQHRDQFVDIVDGENVGLSGTVAVEATEILSQGAFP